MAVNNEKFHIGKNGPVPCEAKKRACRYGEANHYSNMQEAESAYSKQQENPLTGITKTVKEEDFKKFKDESMENWKIRNNIRIGLTEINDEEEKDNPDLLKVKELRETYIRNYLSAIHLEKELIDKNKNLISKSSNNTDAKNTIKIHKLLNVSWHHIDSEMDQLRLLVDDDTFLNKLETKYRDSENLLKVKLKNLKKVSNFDELIEVQNLDDNHMEDRENFIDAKRRSLNEALLVLDEYENDDRSEIRSLVDKPNFVDDRVKELKTFITNKRIKLEDLENELNTSSVEIKF